MPDNGTILTSNQYKRIQELVLDEPLFIVGIGNAITPWPIEGMPPVVDPEIEEQIEVIGYVPINQREAIIEVTVPTIGTINLEGRYFQPIDASSLQLLRAAGTQLIYFKTAIFHKDLVGAVSYRTLALYRNVTLASDFDFEASPNFIPADKVESATMFFMRNVSPVPIQGSYVEEVVHMIVEARV